MFRNSSIHFLPVAFLFIFKGTWEFLVLHFFLYFTFSSLRFSIFVFLIITTLSLSVILCSFDDFSDHYFFKNYFILIWLCIQHKALRNFADCLLGYFKNWTM